jgi:prepilin-type processing-associated H-X9-DG protein
MTNPRTHYPDERHVNVFNVLFCDGHAVGMTQNDEFPWVMAVTRPIPFIHQTGLALLSFPSGRTCFRLDAEHYID